MIRKWIFWSYERGSFQYDALCALILVAIFLIPTGNFHDRPPYMRISGLEDLRVIVDDDGNQVYTVKVERSSFGVTDADMEIAARERLRDYLQSEDTLNIYRVEPVENTWGSLEAYSFWLIQ